MSVVVDAPGRLLGGKFLAPALAALGGLILVMLLSFALEGDTTQTQTATTVTGVSDYALKEIPPTYLAAYQAAGQKYGLDWAILAGIGWVETQHGKLNATGVTSGANFAGCCGGPMQFYFMASPRANASGPAVRAQGRVRVGHSSPATWGTYGEDGNGDGWKDVWDPADAIPAAAHYLADSGAPADWEAAIWAYNHLHSEYTDAMAKAALYRGAATTVISSAGGGSLVTPPADPGDHLASLISAMNKLEAARQPYCYGGGHGSTPAVPSGGQYCWGGNPLHKIYGGGDVGMDCSSSVSWVLQSSGFNVPTMTSGGFSSWGKPGPGKAVTIWSNFDHVFMQLNLNGRAYFWGTAYENYRHGPGWTAPHATQGFIATHPDGL